MLPTFALLAVLLVLAFVLLAALLKKSPASGESPSAGLSPFRAPEPVKGEHDAALAVMTNWYVEAKRKEFEESVLKDVVEKFSKSQPV